MKTKKIDSNHVAIAIIIAAITSIAILLLCVFLLLPTYSYYSSNIGNAIITIDKTNTVQVYSLTGNGNKIGKPVKLSKIINQKNDDFSFIKDFKTNQTYAICDGKLYRFAVQKNKPIAIKVLDIQGISTDIDSFHVYGNTYFFLNKDRNTFYVYKPGENGFQKISITQPVYQWDVSNDSIYYTSETTLYKRLIAENTETSVNLGDVSSGLYVIGKSTFTLDLFGSGKGSNTLFEIDNATMNVKNMLKLDGTQFTFMQAAGKNIEVFSEENNPSGSIYEIDTDTLSANKILTKMAANSIYNNGYFFYISNKTIHIVSVDNNYKTSISTADATGILYIGKQS